MKYRQEITVNAPIEKVVAFFDDPEAFEHSHPGLVGVEHVSGTPRQPGSKSVMKFKGFNLNETVLVNDLPREFTGMYEVAGMVNTMKNSFVSLEGGKTKYTIEMDYQFKATMMKIMALLMPGKFKGQTHRYLELFKEFVERHS